MYTKRQNKRRGQSKNLPNLKHVHDLNSILSNIYLPSFIAGDFENGVEHLSNAVAVCGQPQHLLQVLQQTLPQQVFEMLVQKLPATSKVGVQER